MPKTAAQKAARRRRRLLKKGRLGPVLFANVARPTSVVSTKIKKNRRKKLLKAERRAGLISGPRLAREGRMNQAFRRAKYAGSGMSKVTDGISIMKTVHNSSVIEDTFSVRREKVANIIGTTSTTLNVNLALYLNPGNTVLFPIFSQIAATYEQYRINELVFSYETEAYAASGTNVSAGKVILATNYDPADSNFSTDTQMENYFNSDRGAPFCEIVHDVLLGDHALKDEPLKTYFVNSSANLIAPTNDSTNNKFYDLGLFQLATQGNASSTAEIGELYVTYSFTMIRPKQQTPLGQNLLAAHIVEGASGTAAAAGSAFLGTTGGVVRPGGNIPVVCTKNTFSLPLVGRFLVSAIWSGSVTVVASFAFGANISTVNLIADNADPSVSIVNAGVTSFQAVYDVSTAGTGSANLVTISGLTSLASGTADIFISQVSSGLTEKKMKHIEDTSRLENRLDFIEQRLRSLQHEYSGLNHSNPTFDYVSVEEEKSTRLRRPPPLIRT